MTLDADIAAWLPEAARFAVRDPKCAYPIREDEAVAVKNAVEKRRVEFAAGRDAAREALEQIGLPDVSVPMGADRAPVWPKGVCGSISHSDGLCIAVVARRSGFQSVGIDVEPDRPLDRNLHESILTPEEMGVSSDQALAIFSAKEALFKALYPITGEMMSFQDAQRVDAGEYRLLRSVGRFEAGETLWLRQTRLADHILSFCEILT